VIGDQELFLSSGRMSSAGHKPGTGDQNQSRKEVASKAVAVSLKLDIDIVLIFYY
jgi:hypothetical protein